MDYNPFSPEVRENPYPYYTYLRQHAPVYQIPSVGFWAVSRYDDVIYILRNPQIFSAATVYATMTGDLNPFPPQAPALVSTDPPDHTRLRKLVNRAFTPRRVASLELHIREVVRQLLERMAAQSACDLIRDFAAPLPGIIIAELMGVEPERRGDFKRWAEDIVRGCGGAGIPQEEHGKIRQSLTDFRTYLQAAIASYRRRPGDNLLSDLVRAEEENQTLTAEEIMSLAILVQLGGNETTTDLLGNAVLALFQHPQEFAKVQADLTLVSQLAEEAVRYEAPVQWLMRQTTQETELAGTKLPAGAIVMALFGSANRDERKFPDPDRFDISRNTEGHVGFGFGIHFCLGAQLARLIARVALEELLRRFPRLSWRDEQVTRSESFFLRGLKSLPLVCDP